MGGDPASSSLRASFVGATRPTVVAVDGGALEVEEGALVVEDGLLAMEDGLLTPQNEVAMVDGLSGPGTSGVNREVLEEGLEGDHDATALLMGATMLLAAKSGGGLAPSSVSTESSSSVWPGMNLRYEWGGYGGGGIGDGWTSPSTTSGGGLAASSVSTESSSTVWPGMNLRYEWGGYGGDGIGDGWTSPSTTSLERWVVVHSGMEHDGGGGMGAGKFGGRDSSSTTLTSLGGCGLHGGVEKEEPVMEVVDEY